MSYFQDQSFENQNLSGDRFPEGEYEYCTFKGGNYKEANMEGVTFVECTFKDCDLSLATLLETAFREVEFIDCKLIGLHFEDCKKFGLDMSFTNCQLEHSSFFGLPLKKTTFNSCLMKGVDFTEADLTEARLKACKLKEAKFERTILKKADLRLSTGFEIDPEINQITGAQFSAEGLIGLLKKYKLKVD
ncbi:MAG: pentapeptide repeat-containing protein [Bacteroidota bacterium]